MELKEKSSNWGFYIGKGLASLAIAGIACVALTHNPNWVFWIGGGGIVAILALWGIDVF
jgi:hypothetical protein